MSITDETVPAEYNKKMLKKLYYYEKKLSSSEQLKIRPTLTLREHSGGRPLNACYTCIKPTSLISCPEFCKKRRANINRSQ